MKYAAMFALALMPCSASAAPVYLKCQLDQGGPGGAGGDDQAAKAPMDITLNEEAGTVTYVFSQIGQAFTVRGVFTVDKVTFRGFTVDRTNLQFQRDLSDLQAPGRTPIIDRGRCTLAEVKRAF